VRRGKRREGGPAREVIARQLEKKSGWESFLTQRKRPEPSSAPSTLIKRRKVIKFKMCDLQIAIDKESTLFSSY